MNIQPQEYILTRNYRCPNDKNQIFLTLQTSIHSTNSMPAMQTECIKCGRKYDFYKVVMEKIYIQDHI